MKTGRAHYSTEFTLLSNALSETVPSLGERCLRTRRPIQFRLRHLDVLDTALLTSIKPALLSSPQVQPNLSKSAMTPPLRDPAHIRSLRAPLAHEVCFREIFLNPKEAEDDTELIEPIESDGLQR